jgi:hypothetical protein
LGTGAWRTHHQRVTAPAFSSNAARSVFFGARAMTTPSN